MFDWKEYKNLAIHINSNISSFPCHEAASRSVVSRAYYAAFCFARNSAIDKDGAKFSKSHKVHEEVRDHYTSKNKIKIARKLDQLSQWRNQCDYDDTVNNLTSLISNTLREADKVITTIQYVV